MSYRFVRVTQYYRDFLNEYYGKSPDIQSKTYKEQYQHLMDQNYSYSDFFALHMEKLGNEAMEIVVNAYPLQKAWANENNVNARGWQLVIEQIRAFRAEIVYLQETVIFSEEFVRSLKEEVPGIRKIIGMCCTILTSSALKTYPAYDILLSCSPEYRNMLAENGLKSQLFYHGFESSLAKTIGVKTAEKIPEVLFIGSFLSTNDYHRERLSFIEQMISAGIPMKIISSVKQESVLMTGSKQLSYYLVRILQKARLNQLSMKLPLIKRMALMNSRPERMKLSAAFRQQLISKSVFGTEMLRELSGYKIGFNIHAGIAGEYAANIRMFEVTGMGSLLLTDHKKNINDLFVPDEEIICYSSVGECLEKLRWLLDHEQDLNRIAAAGQAKTLQMHSLASRVEQLNELILQDI